MFLNTKGFIFCILLILRHKPLHSGPFMFALIQRPGTLSLRKKLVLLYYLSIVISNVQSEC